MDRKQQPIDEYMLAAFLSGTLPEEQHRNVTAYLAENADARELLCMAQEALDAAQQPVSEPFTMPATAPEKAISEPPKPSRHPGRRALRPAIAPALRRRPVRWMAATALMAAVLVIGLRVGLSLNDIDRQRGAGEEEMKLQVRVTTPALQFHWNEIEDAYYYQLVVFDVEAVEVVEQHETKSTRLGRNDAFILSLMDKLVLGRTYLVRIDARDIQNRLIQSSEPVLFSLQE